MVPRAALLNKEEETVRIVPNLEPLLTRECGDPSVVFAIITSICVHIYSYWKKV